MRILLTTSSFQDTHGPHHEFLAGTGYEIVRGRGPLKEDMLLDLIRKNGGFDGFLNGDDHITAKVIDAALAAPTKLRAISKFGVGVDSIDVNYATANQVAVLNTPGVTHTTVAEHTVGLMIALLKHFWPTFKSIKSGGWKRVTGNELLGKTIAVLGMGRIGKEVIKRILPFEMKPVGYDVCWDEAFALEYKVQRAATIDEAIRNADIVSLHMNLDAANRGMVNKEFIAKMKKGAWIINTARGGLVNEADLAAACSSGQLGGYATDTIEVEPQPADHPFTKIDNIIVTPHTGARTQESVERTALRAAMNLVNYLGGSGDFIQANKF